MAEKVSKQTEKKIKKEVEKEIRKEVEKGISREVEKEVKKALHEVVYERTLSSALKFKREFKDQIVIAITAAFAFLIALSWRNPIQKSVDSMIESLGLKGSAIYLEYLSALVITLIAVLVLMWISKWKSKEDK
jgi:uncharacterized membrane protein YdbT with pleckstrin-like domain